MTIKFFLSSTSKCKVQALQTLGKSVTKAPCNSKVSHQPWGRYETMLGAWNRQTELYSKVAKLNKVYPIVLVSIENGLYPDLNGSLHNVAYIIMETVKPYKMVSKEIMCCSIPKDIINYYRETKNLDIHEKIEIFKGNEFENFLKSRYGYELDAVDWPTVFHPQGYNRIRCLSDGLKETYRKLN